MATNIDRTDGCLSFGPFNLLVHERLLTKESVRAELGARALDILIALTFTLNEIVRKKNLTLQFEQFRPWQSHSFYRRAGGFDRRLAVAQRAEAVAKEIADSVGIMAAHWLLGQSHHLIGNPARKACTYLEAALAPAPASNSAEIRRFAEEAFCDRVAQIVHIEPYPRLVS